MQLLPWYCKHFFNPQIKNNTAHWGVPWPNIQDQIYSHRTLFLLIARARQEGIWKDHNKGDHRRIPARDTRYQEDTRTGVCIIGWATRVTTARCPRGDHTEAGDGKRTHQQQARCHGPSPRQDKALQRVQRQIHPAGNAKVIRAQHVVICVVT